MQWKIRLKMNHYCPSFAFAIHKQSQRAYGLKQSRLLCRSFTVAYLMLRHKNDDSVRIFRLALYCHHFQNFPRFDSPRMSLSWNQIHCSCFLSSHDLNFQMKCKSLEDYRNHLQGLTIDTHWYWAFHFSFDPGYYLHMVTSTGAKVSPYFNWIN